MNEPETPNADTLPAAQLPASRPGGIDITNPYVNAVMNVAVFTPYAIYLARGKKPPPLLVAASLAWLGVQFVHDLNMITTRSPGLGVYPHKAPPGPPVDFNRAKNYRVNRVNRYLR